MIQQQNYHNQLKNSLSLKSTTRTQLLWTSPLWLWNLSTKNRVRQSTQWWSNFSSRLTASNYNKSPTEICNFNSSNTRTKCYWINRRSRLLRAQNSRTYCLIRLMRVGKMLLNVILIHLCHLSKNHIFSNLKRMLWVGKCCWTVFVQIKKIWLRFLSLFLESRELRNKLTNKSTKIKRREHQFS